VLIRRAAIIPGGNDRWSSGSAIPHGVRVTSTKRPTPHFTQKPGSIDYPMAEAAAAA
jgi:hypothetical protein